MKKIIISFLLIAVLAMACAPIRPDGQDRDVTTKGTYTPVSAFDPGADVRPTNFKSTEEFQAFVGVGDGGYGGVGLNRFAAESAPMAADAAVSSKGGGAPSFSTTNNQVAGVDEADIVKTDGEYIYTVTGTTLFIISAGEDARVIQTIELDQQPTGLFIQGDKLAVFGNFYDIDYFRDIGFVPRRGGMTYFNVYDISDKENPELLEEYKFEGTYFQARMYGDHVYFVVTSFPDGRGDYPTPVMIDGTTVRGMDVSDIYYFPVPYDNVQLATVHSINLADLGAAVSSKAIAVEWDNKLYMSQDNIYITTTESINEWEIRQEIIMELLESQLTADDRDLIGKIKGADNDVLSQAEKEQKIYQVYSSYYEYMKTAERQDFDEGVDKELSKRMEKYDALTYTIINRMSVDDGKVTIEGTGKVPGSLNNQFAMDEYNGYLRVATTIQPRWNWWGRPMPVDIAADSVAEPMIAPDEPVAKMAVRPQEQSTNNVYVLDRDMDIVGKLTGLAQGETIQSTRFMGDRLYMVTFRQVDPFFAIDLSDPTNPKEMGQLKIPGFSRYLHPYDDNIIIGIGRDATDMGRQQGLKISLFDVTNPEKPKELAKWVADDEYSQSAAEYEHKAFLFDKEKELLVIPAYSYSWDGGSRNKYNGAMVFHITADDIEMRGIIDHSGKGTEYYGPSVERSLWIDDLLYTKSPNLLRVNEISDLSSVTNVTLTSKASGPYPVY